MSMEAENSEEADANPQPVLETELISAVTAAGGFEQESDTTKNQVITDSKKEHWNDDKQQNEPVITTNEDIVEDEDKVIGQSPPVISNDTESSILLKDVSINASFPFDTNTGHSGIVLLRKDSHQFCRICHEAGTDDVFISPCKCKGSLSLVHKWCLEHWLAESDTNHCELCGFIFNVHRKPKYNIIWSMLLWLWNSAPKRERRLLICDTLLFTIVCPLIAFLTIFSFQLAETILVPDINEKITELQARLGLQWRREDIQLLASLLARLLQMTIISLMITFDVGFASWSILRFQYHTGRWYRWYRRNSEVVLRGYPEIRRPTISATESVSNIRTISF